MFQELSKSLESATGKLYAVKCDISNESEVLAAFKWVKDNLGGVDILINNAAAATETSLTGNWLQHCKFQLEIKFLYPYTVGLGALHENSAVRGLRAFDVNSYKLGQNDRFVSRFDFSLQICCGGEGGGRLIQSVRKS
jgi:NAD(P)-dependent dehydrogenase (short-subunit alcohol dehydrogenase family)